MRALAGVALAIAVALAVLAGCARPEVPEDERAETPRPLPDTLAHADTIVADLKQREEEQRALEARMPKPSGEIPVVIEMPRVERTYRPRYYQNYSVPALPRSDEAQWTKEAVAVSSLRFSSAAGCRAAHASAAGCSSALLPPAHHR